MIELDFSITCCLRPVDVQCGHVYGERGAHRSDWLCDPTTPTNLRPYRFGAYHSRPSSHSLWRRLILTSLATIKTITGKNNSI
jgi:hypothetical protein